MALKVLLGLSGGRMPFSLSLIVGALVLSCLLAGSETRIVKRQETTEMMMEDTSEMLQYTTDFALNNSEFVIEDLAVKADNDIENFFNQSAIRSRFIQALKNLSSYLPISVEYAIKKSKDCDIINNNKDYYERVPLIISAFLILLGVVFAFFGYRLIKIVLFLIGFLMGFAVSYFIILTFTHDRPEHWIPYAALGGSAVIGLILGLLTICIYYIGIFLAGSSIGFLIAWFILASINVEFFRDHIYVPIIIAIVVGIVAGLIALLLQKWFFMIGTAILGSFIITWGLDYYLELGAMIYYLLLFAEHRTDLKPCWYSWTIIPIFFIVGLAGFLIQAFVTGRKYNHKKELRGVCCGLCRKNRKKDEKTAPDGKGNYMKLKPVPDDEKK